MAEPITEVRPLQLGEDSHYEAMDMVNDLACFGIYTNGKLRAISIDQSSAVAESVLAAVLDEDHERA